MAAAKKSQSYRAPYPIAVPWLSAPVQTFVVGQDGVTALTVTERGVAVSWGPSRAMVVGAWGVVFDG
jgi:hypothetical protein